MGAKGAFGGKLFEKQLGYSKPQNAIAAHINEDDALKQGIIIAAFCIRLHFFA